MIKRCPCKAAMQSSPGSGSAALNSSPSSDSTALNPFSGTSSSEGDAGSALGRQTTPAGATDGEEGWDAELIFGPDPLMGGACDQYNEVPLDALAGDGRQAVPQVEAPRRSAKSKRGGCSFCRRQRIKCCGNRPCLNCLASPCLALPRLALPYLAWPSLTLP